MDARSLELFFIDGLPDGMLTAEVFNWTGHVLRFPRTKFREALRRPETQHTGVYVLIGERDGTPLAYIGEAENVADRLRGHIANKDWWDSAVCISTTGDLLHKAHVKYLESRLVEIARQIGSMPLENGNTPPRSSLSEAAQANMESFLETLGIVLPAIRVDMFLNKARSVPKAATIVATPAEPAEEKFILQTPKHDLYAEAILRDGEWVVQAGARARGSWVGSNDVKTHYGKLHSDLVENGILILQNGFSVFQQDYAFSSPSAAGAVINGRSTNGRREWKHSVSGQTYEDWEKAQIAAEVTP
ncbi:GIY-YIG nuclease family protein [Sulfitobacter sp.]|uniref:GIY-YIG nuclease family protein n=1 Tax=Sulfitobacter sp. TaxID=1903071 RepID=UPI003F6ABA03